VASPSRYPVDGLLFICLGSLAANAVLIQTVIPEDSPGKTIVRGGIILVAIYALILGNAQVPKWYVGAFLACLAMLAFRSNSDQLTYVFVLILVPLMRTVRQRRLEWMLTAAAVGSLLLVFLFLGVGLTQNEIIESETLTRSRARMTFGTYGVPFFYNLAFGAFTMLVYYTQKYEIYGRKIILVASLFAASGLYRVTDARGGYLAFLAFLGLLWLVPKIAPISALRSLLTFLPVVNFGLALYMASLGSNSGANELFSYRPRLYSAFLENVGLEDIAFSLSVKQFDQGGTIVDNSYLHLLVGGGVIVLAAYLTLYVRAMRRLFSEKRYAEIAFLTAASLYFNSESILLRIELIFVVFSWFLVLSYSEHPIAPSKQSLRNPKDVRTTGILR